jgi:heme-degrading monooxygenase HmoA
MFVAVYQWKVKKGREQEFRDAWIRVTEANYRAYGSLGSRLHQNDDGSWVAYAQWPSKQDWEYAWKSGRLADPASSAVMKDCVEVESAKEQFFPSFSLTVIEDMLQATPHSAGKSM